MYFVYKCVEELSFIRNIKHNDYVVYCFLLNREYLKTIVNLITVHSLRGNSSYYCKFEE
jgi:hypothetical protein